MAVATIVALTVVSGYLLGSIPFGYLLGRALGVDLLAQGSKSTGATNALRTLGAGPAIATLVLDVGKAIGAVLLARAIAASAGPRMQSIAAVIAALTVILGHSWSIFLRGKGGKSVAASAGAALMLMPIVLAWGFVVFVLTVVTTRFVSLGSLLAALTIIIGAFVAPTPPEVRAFAVIAGITVIYRHRANIQRLLAGTENKFGAKAKR